ncbi:uncharacterized protein N0V89_000359 [Didymosphaeria variabile]|uniref:Mediator of RNA polymerase II transcription subunit 1 n=1 Tax=Didymosphaeria variabile TaxID=1932322 RepID=A0A9W8XUJ2_9PLEO|nr:uncharacterized protein N0V89_000359 [Didymosphaeria variabile]KAJ4359803.1 hypothetical protein N0V89_000359 [Didymosphaeria variabile]
MATPTPSTNTPQKQHLHNLPGSSPAPRSVPPMNFDSPAVLNMLGEGGVGMGISMSGMGMSSLGLTASQLGRADEEERRRRLESIIALINKRKGRVSEEGIAALCKQEHLELLRDVQGDGTVVLVLGLGDLAVCEISLLNEDVTKVNLDLASDDDDVYKTSGSRILKNSLIPQPGVRKINTTLDRFALNLEKLMNMDKLSKTNAGIDCYKAIFSVHASLKKLFEHEKKLALELLGSNTPNASYKAEREVLCKKSGRPRMNAGHCLGLSLEYWMDRRHLIAKKPSKTVSFKGKEDETDSKTLEAYPEEADPANNKIYSLTIECESSPSSMYTPIRIPDSWIGGNIEKASDAQPEADINNLLLHNPQSKIDWLEPKPTYLDTASQAGDHDAMNIDNAPGRLPNIRFVAKFNPPLVVPLSLYVTVMQSVGLEYNPQDLRATTFVGLALRPEETDPGMSTTAGGHTPEVRSTTKVLTIDHAGKEDHNTHTNTLYVPRLEYARTLDSLPFQHPRQLVALLPTFRQYALTTSLVQDVFGAHAPPKATPQQNPLSPPITPKDDKERGLQFDLTLAYTTPAPKLALHIPHPLSSTSETPLPNDASDFLSQLLSQNGLSSSATAPHPPLRVVVDVGENAEIYISEQNVVDADAGASKTGEAGEVDMENAEKAREKVKRVEKALDVCGDLGIWAEWIRREAVKDA